MSNVPPKFYSVCRLCLSFCGDNCSDVKLPIFESDKSNTRLSEMIMTYLSVMVSPIDGLPQVVCGSCADKLDAFHTFRNLSHKSDRLLERYLLFVNSLSGSKEADSGWGLMGYTLYQVFQHPLLIHLLLVHFFRIAYFILLILF